MAILHRLPKHPQVRPCQGRSAMASHRPPTKCGRRREPRTGRRTFRQRVRRRHTTRRLRTYRTQRTMVAGLWVITRTCHRMKDQAMYRHRPSSLRSHPMRIMIWPMAIIAKPTVTVHDIPRTATHIHSSPNIPVHLLRAPQQRRLGTNTCHSQQRAVLDPRLKAISMPRHPTRLPTPPRRRPEHSPCLIRRPPRDLSNSCPGPTHRKSRALTPTKDQALTPTTSRVLTPTRGLALTPRTRTGLTHRTHRLSTSLPGRTSVTAHLRLRK